MQDQLSHLLRLAVEDVIQTGEPVGSQRIVETSDLGVSSATIRNWFAELEELGYLIQPHTSSGRIPTEKGYRMYVEELMERKTLPKKDRAELEKAISSTYDQESRMKVMGKKVSELAGNAVVLGLHDADTFYTGLSQLFAQPEFKDWNRVVDIGEVLDRLDDVLANIRRETYPIPTALFGKHCPFGSACGSILLSVDDAIFGILGPIRMDYQHGFALLGAIKELTRTT